MNPAPPDRPDGLKPGDRVIDLHASVRTISTVTGIAAGVFCALAAGGGAIPVLTALVGGASIGLLVGTVAGRNLHRAPPGEAVVIRRGPDSLPTLLLGALVGSGITALLIALSLGCVGGLGVFPEGFHCLRVALLSVVVGLSVGAFWAFLTSRV